MQLVALLVIVFSGIACNEMPAPFKVANKSPQSDCEAPFDPETQYPGWAYDEPEYVKPAGALTPEPRVKKGDPLHYFTNKTIVPVRQPSGYVPEEIPRIAIWWTDNNGFHWHKAGHFGRQQSFFPFEVEEDGDYGVRFVGPGQEAAMHALAYPERVYHVDTVVPEVEITIDPEQSWYYPGQTITIAWRAADYHLTELPVCIGMLMDFTADEHETIELQRDLADEGTIVYHIPADTLDHEIRFRADAEDRAGNLGIAFSYALQVIDEELVQSGEYPSDDFTDEETWEENAEDEPAKAKRVASSFPNDAETNDLGDTSVEQESDEDATVVLSFPSEADANESEEKATVEQGPPLLSPDANTSASAGNEDETKLPTWEISTPETHVADSSSDPKRSNDSIFDASLAAPADSPSIMQMTPHNETSVFAETTPTTDTPVVAQDTESSTTAIHQEDDTPPVRAMSLTGSLAVEPTFNEKADTNESTTTKKDNARTTPVTNPVQATTKVPDDEPAWQSRPTFTPVHKGKKPSTPTPEPKTTTPAESSVESMKRISLKVPTWEPEPVVEDVPVEAKPVTNEVIVINETNSWQHPPSPSPTPATAIDLTHGNGLLVPMPATVEPNQLQIPQFATAHPWRSLGTEYSKPLQTVWALPKPQFDYELGRMFDGNLLAEYQMLIPVAEPGMIDHAFAGLPSENIETEPALVP